MGIHRVSPPRISGTPTALIHVRIGDTRHHNRKNQHSDKQQPVPLHVPDLRFLLLLMLFITMNFTLSLIPPMILVGVDPILPAAAGTPGVTVMPPMSAAATAASEDEEEEQSPENQPDQPSSHQRDHPPFHRISAFFSVGSICISHAVSLIVLILQQYRPVSRPMDFLARQEIQHFLRSCEEYSPVSRCIPSRSAQRLRRDPALRRISDTDLPIPIDETDVESPGDDGDTERTPGRLACPRERKATWMPRRRKPRGGGDR
jgi:hypothetical protein